MGLPETTVMSKVNLLVTFFALILYIVGMATPHWLEKDFVLPAGALPVPISVEANMGLFESCSVKTPQVPNPTPSEEDCSAEGAADWQKAAAGLAIAGLVVAVAGLVLSLLNVCVKKTAEKIGVRVAIICCHILTAGFMAAPLIMYAMNRKFQVQPPLPYQFDFDLAWSFSVAAAAAAVYAVLPLLNIIDIILRCGKVDILKE